jgi:glutaredoxin 3
MPRIRVYTRSNCGWSSAVKSLLRKHGYTYRELPIDEDDDATRFLSQRLAFTVPQVFVGDRRVGGYEATVEAMISGELDRLLEAEPGAAALAERHGA